MRSFVLTGALLALSACATMGSNHIVQSSSGWRLVYAHDAAGKTLKGEKQNLIKAVQQGKPVRIYTAGRRIGHATEAMFLSIFEGEIFAQTHPIKSQRPDVSPLRILFRQPGQQWRMIIGTNGSVTALMDGNEPNERTGGASWFVED